jgi:hypothetical protein
MKSWDRDDGMRYNYFVVDETEVVLGHHYGTGQSDVAGACAHEEFLNGRFNPEVRERFGEDVLAEGLELVKELQRR